MSYLELLLLFVGIILPFYISIKNNKHNLHSIIIIGLFILHLIVDGLRWQMIPIYLILFILIVCLFKKYRFFKGNWFRKIASALFLFLTLGIGFSLSTILPVFDLPTPSGKHKIGSQYLHFISDEKEAITTEKGDKRELMIKVWYPAKVELENKEAYLNKAERIGFAQKYGLPKNTFNYLNKIATNTFESPNIAEGKFPVLIFSHGYYSKASGYYALIEEIVSHGYIVLNINHTYESVGTLFPSGEMKFYDRDYDRQHNNQEMASMVWKAMENFKKATSKAEKKAAIKSTVKNYFAAEITERWTKDINKVFNQIYEWERSTFLAKHIDMTKIGVFGHSQGGAAAAQALLENSNIVAGINMDGTQWGEMIDTFISKPFLLMSSDWPKAHPNFNEHIFQYSGTSDFYKVKIRNSGHSNFMDIPYMINLSSINEAGSIEPKKATRASARVIIAFFDKYLNIKDSKILYLNKNYPELEMEKH